MRFYFLILFATMMIGAACEKDGSRPEIRSQDQHKTKATMRLFVKLRDGFSNATVTIKVDGKEAYHKSGVSSDLTISFADAVEIPVEEAVVELEVAVEGGQTAAKEIRVQETPFVEVWIIEGKMELRASAEETPML